MPENKKPSSRLNPTQAWTSVTDAPLLGLSLAREAGLILAWDEARNVYLIDLHGERLTSARAPGAILGGCLSDSGSLAALLIEGSRLLLLDRELTTLSDRPTSSEPTCLDIDPHGRYLAIGTKTTQTLFYSRFGRPAGKFETKQPLSLVRFVPAEPILLAASAYGSLLGVELIPQGSTGSLEGEVLWDQRLLSNVGRLETSGDGSLILASCYTHGVQRFDLEGRNAGSYHLGGTVSHAVPDFAGRSIAVATLEGEVVVINQAGNVRWRSSLPRPAIALQFDALGRYLVHGLPTGEISLIDLEGRRPEATATTVAVSPARAGSVREPDWSIPCARSDEEAEAAVLAVLDDPPRIGYISRGNRLSVFTTQGELLGQAPEIAGVGRILRTAPGWIAAATDRMIVLLDAKRGTANRIDLSLVEVTHLVIRPDQYGLAIVQERDRVGRATTAGRWVWKRELPVPVEDIVVGPRALTAISCDDGALLILDAAGEIGGRYQSDPHEPLLLTEAAESSADGATWITMARRSQILRGHRADGRVLWESPTPWEPWHMQRVGPSIVLTAPDGRALAYDGSGYLLDQSAPEDATGVFCPGPAGAVWRVVRKGVHLICTDLAGHVNWRSVSDQPLGPLAAGRVGAAIMLGRSLAWFDAPSES